MYLDPAIRDWVLFPIMIVMVLVGILRQHIAVLMNSPPKVKVKAVRETWVKERREAVDEQGTREPLTSRLSSPTAKHWDEQDD